ncbi:hypothetical protein D770_24735 [Flammeovirgaceae bacterium 311]|nr:hypothetical protein D770_24735 [Flammeovirgaceae bacterium 311]
MIVMESDNPWDQQSSEDRLELFMSSLHEGQKIALDRIKLLFNYDDGWIRKAFGEAFNEYHAEIGKVSVEDPTQFQRLFVILYLAINRIAINEQLFLVLSTALSEKELIDELMSLHRITKGFLDDTFTSPLNLVPAVESIKQGEYQHFSSLMSELKLLIRSKGKQSINPSLKKLTKGITSEQTVVHSPGKKKLDDTNLPPDKQIKVIVNKDWHMLVLTGMQKHVSEEQYEVLSNLLKNGNGEHVYFNNKQNILVDLFSRLYKNGLLYGVTSQEELARWLSNNFSYKSAGESKPVTYGGALNLISRGLNIPIQAKRICFIEGLKDDVN